MARRSINGMKAALLIVTSALIGCSQATPEAAPEKPDDAMSQIRSAIVQKARGAAGGADCPEIVVPETALLSIEVTGSAPAEIAVALDNLPCPRAFSGTPGGIMQFWTLDGGKARLILEQQMRYFSATDGGLVTLQHGGECGAPGTHHCQITYRWDTNEQRLGLSERVLASKPTPRMDYDYQLRRPGA